MKQEVITVPKDKCPLDVLADMGEETYTAGILFSPEGLNKMLETADRHEKLDSTAYLLSWNATEKFPQTTIIIVGEQYSQPVGLQYRAVFIHANDISFRRQLDDRTVDYFLTMEE